MFANTGPCTKRNDLVPGAGSVFDDLGAGDVARHEIGRELDPVELQIQHLGQRADQQRLRESRHTDEQAVSAREKCDEQMLDDGVLSDDDLGDFRAQAVVGLLQLPGIFNIM